MSPPLPRRRRRACRAFDRFAASKSIAFRKGRRLRNRRAIAASRPGRCAPARRSVGAGSATANVRTQEAAGVHRLQGFDCFACPHLFMVLRRSVGTGSGLEEAAGKRAARRPCPAVARRSMRPLGAWMWRPCPVFASDRFFRWARGCGGVRPVVARRSSLAPAAGSAVAQSPHARTRSLAPSGKHAHAKARAPSPAAQTRPKVLTRSERPRKGQQPACVAPRRLHLQRRRRHVCEKAEACARAVPRARSSRVSAGLLARRACSRLQVGVQLRPRAMRIREAGRAPCWTVPRREQKTLTVEAGRAPCWTVPRGQALAPVGAVDSTRVATACAPGAPRGVLTTRRSTSPLIARIPYQTPASLSQARRDQTLGSPVRCRWWRRCAAASESPPSRPSRTSSRESGMLSHPLQLITRQCGFRRQTRIYSRL